MSLTYYESKSSHPISCLKTVDKYYMYILETLDSGENEDVHVLL